MKGIYMIKGIALLFTFLLASAPAVAIADHHYDSYARTNTVEVGASVGLFAIPGLVSAQLCPQVGWFIADKIELSGIASVSQNIVGIDGRTTVGFMLEPSYHNRFRRDVLGFLGLGLGAVHIEDRNTRFGLVPRVGMKFLVGKRGILSTFLSYQYTRHDNKTDLANGIIDTSTIGVSHVIRANIGYTIMF